MLCTKQRSPSRALFLLSEGLIKSQFAGNVCSFTVTLAGSLDLAKIELLLCTG